MGDGNVDDVVDDDNSNSGLWYIGVILCLFGSISLNLGNNIQSLGLQGQTSEEASSENTQHESLPQKDDFMERESSYVSFRPSDVSIDGPVGEHCTDVPPPRKEDTLTATKKAKGMHSPSTFVFGTVLFVSGSLLTFVAFGFAAQSLLASLEGVQFVSNVVFARAIRKVPVTPSVVFGVALIVGGVATVVLSGPHDSQTRTSQELFELYVSNHAYQAFLVIAGGAAVVLRYTEKAFTKRLTLPGRTPWPFSATVIPVTYAAFSALFGTQSVVQAKCLMMCLSLTVVEGENQFGHPFTYALLGVWVGTTYMWLTRMGEALKRFDPMFIIPVLQVLFILLAILSGGIYFEEFVGLSTEQWFGFIGGVLLVCGGLYCLAPKNQDVSALLPPPPPPLPTSSDEDKRQQRRRQQEGWPGYLPVNKEGILVVGGGDGDDDVGSGSGLSSAGSAARTRSAVESLPSSDDTGDGGGGGEEETAAATTAAAYPNVKISVSGVEIEGRHHSQQQQPHGGMRGSPRGAGGGGGGGGRGGSGGGDEYSDVSPGVGGGGGGGDGGSGASGNYPHLLLAEAVLGQAYGNASLVGGLALYTASELAGVLEAVGAVVAEDLSALSTSTQGAANQAVLGASAVVLTPTVAVTSGLSSVGGAVGSAGGWLRFGEDGGVDWLATTSQLNLLAAGAASQQHGSSHGNSNNARGGGGGRGGEGTRLRVGVLGSPREQGQASRLDVPLLGKDEQSDYV